MRTAAAIGVGLAVGLSLAAPAHARPSDPGVVNYAVMGKGSVSNIVGAPMRFAWTFTDPFQSYYVDVPVCNNWADVGLPEVYLDPDLASFGGAVSPYFAGGLPEARGLHAYDYLYWSLMERGARRGAARFDFGRSKRGTGAFDYKTHWGFEPEPLSYQFHLVKRSDLPNVNPLNPKYRLMVETWKRLPLPVANRLGPLIARQLG